MTLKMNKKISYFFVHFRLQLVHVRGKRGLQVPLIIAQECVKAIDVLIQTREKVGVNHENLYLFAAPIRQSKMPLRGYQAISAVVKKVDGLEKPDVITSTKL